MLASTATPFGTDSSGRVVGKQEVIQSANWSAISQLAKHRDFTHLPIRPKSCPFVTGITSLQARFRENSGVHLWS
jgi:hypothetical protein